VGPAAGASEGPLLSCGRVKLYSDGSLGAETAALRRPYVGTSNRGVLIMTPEVLTDKIASAHRVGFQLEVSRALWTASRACVRACRRGCVWLPEGGALD
jgi:hypothetical protein